jgi:biopolymer transport protein ExbB
MYVGLLTSTLAAAPASGDAGLVATVWELTWKGGVVMIPIAIASLIAIAYAIERAIVLKRSRVSPPRLLDEVVAAANDSERAIALCRARPSPLGRILEAGLSAWQRSDEQVEKRLVEAGLREASMLKARLKVLGFVIGVSPMLGLLGTIFGMITAFRTVASSPDALGRTELLAGGIYVALVTTAAGLLVAIPVMLLYHLLAAKAERRLVELDLACRTLMDRHGAPNAARAPAAERAADRTVPYAETADAAASSMQSAVA